MLKHMFYKWWMIWQPWQPLQNTLAVQQDISHKAPYSCYVSDEKQRVCYSATLSLTLAFLHRVPFFIFVAWSNTCLRRHLINEKPNTSCVILNLQIILNECGCCCQNSKVILLWNVHIILKVGIRLVILQSPPLIKLPLEHCSLGNEYNNYQHHKKFKSPAIQSHYIFHILKII